MNADRRATTRTPRDHILFHARECEKCLRLADFALSAEACFSADTATGIAQGMRKLADMASVRAFAWSRTLRQQAAA